MRKGQKRWGAAGAAFLLIAVGAVYLRHKGAGVSHRSSDLAPEEGAANRRWLGFPAGLPVVAGAPAVDGGKSPDGDWFSAQITPQQLELAMDAWRHAILLKNADDVMTLDRAFAVFPGRYGPELVKLAETDPEERVRAFSTRVLGKFQNVELVEVFERLLEDKSPFVRQNAAWALGELADRPNGRGMAQIAVDELRQREGNDPSPDVRTAATKALKRLQ